MNAERKYLDDLNEAQREAVLSPFNRPVFVFAGAGSGKTRTLISRIAEMINRGVRADSILAMTFTRKAAEEIRERIRFFIGPRADGVHTSTYHQLCLRMIEDNPFILNIQKKNFKVADGQTQRKIVSAACKTLPEFKNLKKKQNTSNLVVTTNKMLNAINRAKVLNLTSSNFSGNFEMVFAHYENHLKLHGLIDFHDFLTYARDLLVQYPVIARNYANTYQYILIDEFQDTSPINFEILKMILEDKVTHQFNQKVTIVGDPRQSIYSFRGADPSIQQSFRDLYPNAKTVFLRQNYRSTACILKAAQSLIKNQENDLYSTNGEGHPVNVIEAVDSVTEAESICNEIEKLVFPGSPYGYRDVTIMFRLRKAATELELELFRRGIPYTLKRGTSFYMRNEIREVISYIRLALNFNQPDDPNALLFSSLEMILNVPDRSIKAGTIGILHKICEATNKSIQQVLTEMIKSTYKDPPGVKALPKATAKKIQDLGNLLFKLNRHICVVNPRLSIDIAIQNIIDMIGLHPTSSDKIEEGTIDGLDDLGEAQVNAEEDAQQTISLFISEARRFYERLTMTSRDIDDLTTENALRKFVDSITLESSVNTNRNAVTLSTIHQMKGKESPICFIIRFNQGYLPIEEAPSAMEIESADGEIIEDFNSSVNLEEERRIAYVGMTRAKVRLFLSFCYSSKGQPLVPSPFLSEIDPAYLSRDKTEQIRPLPPRKFLSTDSDDSDSDI